MRIWMRKRIISVLLIFVMILPYAVVATGTTTTDDLKSAQNKKSSLEKQIEDTKAQVNQLAKDSTDIESYIKSIDLKMAQVDSSINDLNIQIDNKQVQIKENQAALEQAKIESVEQYASMKLRIQYMYEHESESYIEIMLAAKDMGDMLNKAEYINKITDYDREMLVKYAETEQMIQDTQVALQNEQTELEDSMASVEAQKSSMKLVQDAKAVELKKLSEKVSQANANATQLQNDKKKQEAEITAMEATIKAAEAAAKASGGPAMNYDGGKFLWPVPNSHRITSYFGEMEDRSVSHNGLDIGAATSGVSGDKIVAAYDGVVTIAAYSTSAGNWIWINHGDGLYTVYMHNSQMLVAVGAKVTKGQVIALMGNTGNSTGAHLHFGVRVDGVFVNPLGPKYLSN
ncbi:murein hydrolase activator EnvC family protein [[Clostridium] fimetarium]|uniref:Septal ring factor EnvC, activator of murein hydrolases AmiA and AmiB n=1 Tax=[Clostridium] fimetarium TaxID=99656 RepID=A0A1I0M3V0_9FIRM|nr:M23 family metallopeptidase [[Clostridium] fimetarium]SEV82972.1 Septal ring factor EnvC, activator of murein hydrolases AmiA and AmiB [[Clostridium] fimetarium]